MNIIIYKFSIEFKDKTYINIINLYIIQLAFYFFYINLIK